MKKFTLVFLFVLATFLSFASYAAGPGFTEYEDGSLDGYEIELVKDIKLGRDYNHELSTPSSNAKLLLRINTVYASVVLKKGTRFLIDTILATRYDSLRNSPASTTVLVKDHDMVNSIKIKTYGDFLFNTREIEFILSDEFKVIKKD